MPVLNSIADFAPEMTEWRRDIHAHPELGFEEHRTSDLVAAKLESWGIEVTRGIAGTGLVGTLRAGTGGRAIGLRADMDCLPMDEVEDGRDHRSVNPGRMHACGHDGHTTMLLGAAKYLAETKNFDGTVHFIFQPAEEGGGGGRVMVEEGLFERFPCDMVFGAHNDTSLPVGTMQMVTGIVCANADTFRITVTGRGGHAARPHRAIDPVVVGSHIVVALQTIVARRTDPIDSAVLSTCMFHAGSASNVIAEVAELRGTVRTLRAEVRDEIEGTMRDIVEHTARAHGASAVLDYQRGYPSVENAPDATERAALAAGRLLGADHVVRQKPPGMGGEDFAYMAQKVPGCFVRIGQADGARGANPVHHPSYDFNDDILPIGASYWATLVEQELPRSATRLPEAPGPGRSGLPNAAAHRHRRRAWPPRRASPGRLRRARRRAGGGTGEAGRREVPWPGCGRGVCDGADQLRPVRRPRPAAPARRPGDPGRGGGGRRTLGGGPGAAGPPGRGRGRYALRRRGPGRAGRQARRAHRAPGRGGGRRGERRRGPGRSCRSPSCGPCATRPGGICRRPR